MENTIIIYKRADCYYADAHGKCGGGYSGAFAGSTPEDAAVFAIKEKTRYRGATVIAPSEVRKHMEGI